MKCTKLLQTKNKIISHQKEKLIEKKLDMIFLRTLVNNTQHVPNIFYIFLKRTSTDTLIRFMSGNANIIDYFKSNFFNAKKNFFKKSLF